MKPACDTVSSCQSDRESWTTCPREEAVNALTHGIGWLLSLIGMIIVIVTCRDTSWLTFTGCFVYALCLVLVYASSTLYHLARNPDRKRLLRTADHMCIYLLIAGTYTPFTLTLLRSPAGYGVLATVWIMAAIGMAVKIFHTGKCDGLSTLAYVIMGWIVLVVIDRVLETFPLGAILWLLAGGLFYTGGVLFYRYDHRMKYFHAIWHLFVMAGSACQYVAVLLYATRAG